MPLTGQNKGVPKGKFKAPATFMKKKFFERSHLSHLTTHLKVIKKYKLHSKEWMRGESQTLSWIH